MPCIGIEMEANGTPAVLPIVAGFADMCRIDMGKLKGYAIPATKDPLSTGLAAPLKTFPARQAWTCEGVRACE